MQSIPSKDGLSRFRLISFAIAAENKALSSDMLEVVPIETQGFVDGELVPNNQVVQTQGQGRDGGAYTERVNSANTIKAKWIPCTSNRNTPPDVRRGERVLLYQYDSTDQYYWITTGLDDHLRRLETVRYLFSNTKDESVRELTPQNSYSLEVSTHTGQITLTTNKSNGEPFAYVFQFNTKEGAVTLMDDSGNTFQLDSQERRFILVNKDQSKIIIDKREIYVESGDLIDMKTKTLNVTAETMNFKATTMNSEITTTNWKGTFNLEGSYNQKGGNSNMEGNVNTTGNLVNNGKNVGSTHTHTSSQPGTPTSPPN